MSHNSCAPIVRRIQSRCAQTPAVWP